MEAKKLKILEIRNECRQLERGHEGCGQPNCRGRAPEPLELLSPYTLAQVWDMEPPDLMFASLGSLWSRSSLPPYTSPFGMEIYTLHHFMLEVSDFLPDFYRGSQVRE